MPFRHSALTRGHLCDAHQVDLDLDRSEAGKIAAVDDIQGRGPSLSAGGILVLLVLRKVGRLEEAGGGLES